MPLPVLLLGSTGTPVCALLLVEGSEGSEAADAVRERSSEEVNTFSEPGLLNRPANGLLLGLDWDIGDAAAMLRPLSTPYNHLPRHSHCPDRLRAQTLLS